MTCVCNRFISALSVWFACAAVLSAQDATLHTFERQRLTDTYFSEGATAADLNRDGVIDAVYGPYWFAGPDFASKYEIYKPVPQNVRGYADNFFAWPHDFNRDGWPDLLVAGFPGTPAYVYENPGTAGFTSHWNKHQVFDWVSNESPQFTNLIGDQRPELVCTRDGFFGFVTVDWETPFGTWEFHPISEKVTATKFGHGLGIGDVNGDGRLDILHSQGWFEQPESQASSSRWRSHKVSFSTAYGGAEMYAYDVDGDGDNDIITGHAAHDFGLGWYEQIRDGDAVSFKHHLIMGSQPAENKYGVLFSELHSLSLADIDGDGLKDIVTGKTYWSHHDKSPLWDAGAVVYWFKLVRTQDGVDWIPYKADGEAGIGRQLTVMDIQGDGLLDIVVGGMKGAHVLSHQVKKVMQSEWQAAQPQLYAGSKLPQNENVTAARGPKSALVEGDTKVVAAIEGEDLPFHPSAGQVKPQGMAAFRADHWSNQTQVWWTGARPGDKLSFDLPEFTGTVDLEAVLTCAPNYGIVQLSLDDQPLGNAMDLYETAVITTGVLSFPKLEVKGRKHTLNVEITGANPKAKQAFMFGLDYIRIKHSDGTFVAATTAGPSAAKPVLTSDEGIKAKSIDGRVLNLDFESGTLEDWDATGNAFVGQPIKGDTVAKRRTDMRSAHTGQYWIGTHELKGDVVTGTLTSAPLVVSEPYASFWTNGGDHEQTRVELARRDTGVVFYQVSGTRNETMRRIVVDLRGHLGKEIMVRLIDEHQGAWGHINFDHFRLHATRPAGVTPPITTLVQDEYPHAGLNAEQAAAAMKVPQGFSVTVGASEPDVKQPVAMALDDRGRVWIAEAYEYPIRAKGDTGRDRILVFEDTDGNGTLDKKKVFAEGLNLVSGLEVGFGGVWVGAAPYLMFIPDRDGDDVADSPPQVLLDGWGYQDSHETLNTFIWGPDGWLYGCHGVFTHSKVGKPGTADDQRVPLNAGVWRYHPTKHQFEVFSHGTSNPWGVDFDDRGQAFITACVIPHLYHMIQGGRYQRQGGQHFNPYTYRDITTIADHLHYLGANPHGGNSKSDQAGGGHAHAGAMIYLGDRWPQQYRNQIFMNNIHGQRLNIDILKPQGSGYVGSHGPDFLLTGDQASQILNLRYGPDGNAWMIDWYDMQACHRVEADRHDRSNGRIYKISYQGPESPRADIDLAQLSDSELAGMTLHKNDWFVRHSRRLLQERAARQSISPDAVSSLVSIATTNADDTRRLRAAWALHVIGQLTDDLTKTLLADQSPYVRGWTIQLAMESAEDHPAAAMLERLTRMAREDQSPVVRLYLASAAQRIAVDQRWEWLEALAGHASDANDHNLPLMVWYAAEPLADVDATRALAFAISAGESIPLVQEFMLRRIGSSDSGSSLAVLVGGLRAADDAKLQLTFLQAIRTALRGQRQVSAPEGWSSVSAMLLKSDDPNVRLQTTALGVTFGDAAAMNAMRARVTDAATDLDARVVALQSLLDANDPGMVPVLQSLLSAESPLRESAIRGLAQYDDTAVAQALLSAYATFTPEQKQMALGSLCARASSGVQLLSAIEANQVAATDLTADLVRQLQFLKNSEVNALLNRVWGTVRESAEDKLALIASYKTLVASKSHPVPSMELGRTVFAKTCMKCHMLYGVGFKIGPDLTGSNRSDLEYLLSNIVDPSAVMAKEYLPTVVLTHDGRVVSGLIKGEDDRSLSLQTSDALVIIPKDEIDERTEGDKSMMPEDQLKPFSEHEIRSLVAYLRGKEQVPMLATSENASAIFNGVDLSGWSGREGLWSVENGELVGRTDGLKRNEWIVSDLSADDFHLSLEVKLVDNAGNSGIQFRSKAEGGEVSGYQADVGAGWWGKLYEEHGRALLWDRSGEAHLKPGEWNKYEVIAEQHHIRTFINGQPCVDLQDPKGALSGIIAFQLHSGGKTEVRFRNINLQILE